MSLIKNKRPTIAVDIDDVLADSAAHFVEFSNRRWGTRLTIDDYKEHWGEIWKVDTDEWQKRAVEYHNSGAVSELTSRKSEAMPVLEELRHRFKLVIVTSRRLQVRKETSRWLELYYNGIFEEIHFAGMWDVVTENSHKATKAKLCKEIDADYLIDDQPKHCIATAKAGIPALLFGNYSWNKNIKNLPPNITRVKNWQEVLEYFSHHDK